MLCLVLAAGTLLLQGLELRGWVKEQECGGRKAQGHEVHGHLAQGEGAQKRGHEGMG